MILVRYNIKKDPYTRVFFYGAETERFELSVRFPIRRISSAVPSTTQPRLLCVLYFQICV